MGLVKLQAVLTGEYHHSLHLAAAEPLDLVTDQKGFGNLQKDGNGQINHKLIGYGCTIIILCII